MFLFNFTRRDPSDRLSPSLSLLRVRSIDPLDSPLSCAARGASPPRINIRVSRCLRSNGSILIKLVIYVKYTVSAHYKKLISSRGRSKNRECEPCPDTPSFSFFSHSLSLSLSRDVSTPRVSLPRVTSGRPCPFVTLHFARDSIAINSVFNQLIIPLVRPPQHLFLVCLCEIRCISSSNPFLTFFTLGSPHGIFSFLFRPRFSLSLPPFLSFSSTRR